MPLDPPSRADLVGLLAAASSVPEAPRAGEIEVADTALAEPSTAETARQSG